MLSTGEIDSNNELFHELKITFVNDGQSHSLDNSSGESGDNDFISLVLLLTPFLTNYSDCIANQPGAANCSVPLNLIRAPPQ